MAEIDVSRKLFEDLRRRTATARRVLGKRAEVIEAEGMYPWNKEDAPQMKIAGTGVSIKTIWEFCEAGYNVDEIIKQYPHLTEKQVRDAMEFPKESNVIKLFEDDGYETVHPPCDVE